MSRGEILPARQYESILNWAVERQVPITASVHTDDRWFVLKSRFLRQDRQQGVIQILFPFGAGPAAPEIGVGHTLGISFRRGHKKCVFTAVVALRQRDTL